jgi:hypothetical protein
MVMTALAQPGWPAIVFAMGLAACSQGDGMSGAAPGGGGGASPNSPSISLAANPASIASGGSTTLTWSSSNASACTASGAWSGAKTTAGSEPRSNLATSGTYTLTCTGSGGSASDSTTVSVVVSGAACAEGAIAASCVCGGAEHTSGFCCSNVWFDPHYQTLIGGCPVAAAYRFVDPAHPAASDSNDGSAAAPWATLGRAVWGSQSYSSPNAGAALQAGQVVLVRSGMHAGVGRDMRNNPVFNPVNDGSAGAPIVIKAVGDITIQPEIGYQGMVQSATATSVQLATDASSTNDAYANWTMRIVAGTGAGQARKIAQTQQAGQGYVSAGSYDGASRTATIHAAWDTIPDNSSRVTLTRPGPLLGAMDRNHVVWDGFRVVEADGYRGDTGPVVIWGSTNVSLLHLDIVGTRINPLHDNHNGIRVEASSAFVIGSCEISGYDSTVATFSNPHNEAAIMLYDDHDGVIEHNLIHHVNSGIYPKGNNGTNLTLRYNLIHDAATAFRLSYHGNVDIRQNVVYDAQMAIRSAEGNSAARFYNNTVYRSGAGPSNWFGSNGIEFFNNVYLDVPFPYDYEGAPGDFTSNYNHFFNYTGFRVNNANIGGLGAWQGLGYDAQSTESDPRFSNPGGFDFHLQGGSPLFSGGRGGAYPSVRGAYVSGDEVIGPRR